MDSGTLATQIQQLDSGYNPTDVYNKITSSLGIPDARTRVQALSKNLVDTENAIKAVDPNVTARTSGALVTEGQRGRLVQMEKAPLTDTYNSQNQSYAQEQGTLADLNGQATQQYGLAENSYKNKRQSLADQLSLAVQKEQAAAAKEEADRQFNENQRQFNVSASQSAAKASAAATSSAPTYQQRSNDKGFNFQDASGKAISARSFAAMTGTDFNKLIQQMASKGDVGAQDFLKNGSKSKYAKALGWG
jgi:hypothetical protein